MKTEKTKTKKLKYNLWQNSIWMTRIAWQVKEKKVLVLVVLAALLAVATNLVEEPEGKAVEFVSKSAEDGEDVVEEAEELFDPQDYTSDVVKYYTKNFANLDLGYREDLRAAVQRVKRGVPTAEDIEMFREVVKNLEN